MDDSFNRCILVKKIIYGKEFEALEYSTMADASLKFLQQSLAHKEISRKEKHMLAFVKKYLNRFLSNFPSTSLYDLWMEKAKEAGCVYTNDGKRDIEEKLNRNFADIRKLTRFLDNFLARHQSNNSSS